jgi:micrococcal nuclease
MKIFGHNLNKFLTITIVGILGGVLIFSSSDNTEPATPTIAVQNVQKSTPLIAQEDKDGTVLVTRVIDGDTIEIEGGQRVRYIGIDTPETVDPRKPVQCFGVEASNHNKQLVEGKKVRLEKDISEADKYGRLLRYIYVGDTLVNLALVEDGFAHSSSYPPDVKYQDKFTEAEKEAREAKKGLWNICPTTATKTSITTTPTAPQKPASTVSPSSCVIKGNISSGGKIYHLPGCGSYTKTQINEAQGEHWFCSEEEAVESGWRKAKNC